jgi:hypothetical protein
MKRNYPTSRNKNEQEMKMTKLIVITTVLLLGVSAAVAGDTFTNGPNGYSAYQHEDQSGIYGYDSKGNTWMGSRSGRDAYINVTPNASDPPDDDQ